jgi:hypothetical protein
MNIDVPMHHVIELVPVMGGGWKEKWHDLNFMTPGFGEGDGRVSSGSV